MAIEREPEFSETRESLLTQCDTLYVLKEKVSFIPVISNLLDRLIARKMRMVQHIDNSSWRLNS